MEEDEVLVINESDDEEVGNVESFIQSVVGPYSLREFIMLPLWTINDFHSTIKQKHFNLREKYQIPVGIPLRLPFKYEKCYYEGSKTLECMNKC